MKKELSFLRKKKAPGFPTVLISASLLSMFLLFGASCTTDQQESKGVIYDSLAHYRDSLETKLNAQDTIRVSFINAYNKECQVIDDSMIFTWPVHIAKNDLGFVRVRSDASCFEVGPCQHNIIGTIKDDQWVWAYGPVKYRYGSAGIAYVIGISDSKGRLVKGYLSYTVLDQY